ncbi:MAG: response regulator [Pseudomonadota bacterium]
MSATILFVDDENNVLQGLRRSMRTMRKEWDMHFAEGGHAALAVLAERHVDVVISDMRMPEMDGAALLEKVAQDYPSTIRFVLSGQADQETTYRAIGPSHQFFSKPSDADVLASTIKRLLRVRSALSADEVHIVSGLRCLPSSLSKREEFRSAITASQPSIETVSDIISKDVGLSLKTLQLTNSTYFGVGADVYCARHAARMLDVGVLSDLVAQKRFSVPLLHEANDAGFTALGDAGLYLAEVTGRIAEKRGLSLDDCSLASIAALFSTIKKLLTLTEHGGGIDATSDSVIAYMLALWGMPSALIDVFDAAVEDNEMSRTVRAMISEAMNEQPVAEHPPKAPSCKSTEDYIPALVS